MRGRLRKGALAICLIGVLAPALSVPATAAPAPAIHVQGNQFVTGTGAPIRLIGVNRASFEYTCVTPEWAPSYRSGIHNGPINDEAVAAFATWHVTAVRVPLNEDCWLGINPVRRFSDHVTRIYGPAARREGRKLRRRYKAKVVAFVERLNAQGIVAILDLHWSAPGSVLADDQRRAPDASHSIAFWRSVATKFRSNPSVIFDLFNEPLHVGWKCLRDGGCKLKSNCADCENADKPAPRYEVVGMQRLVNVIRATGATQPLMIPGLRYSHDLRKWLAFRPRDPLASGPRGSQIVASFHNYVGDQEHMSREGYLCHRTCWEETIAPIAARFPVVTGEFGQFDCKSRYNTDFMTWADAHGVSYLAWWWYVKEPGDGRGCGLSLISNYLTGGPTPYGAPIRSHFLAVNP
jgi:hypothetical protein